MEIRFKNLTKFYPYEQIHARIGIRIECKSNPYWYMRIVDLLEEYEADEYFGCGAGYFNPTMDNKITLELDNNLYITLWDSIVYISAAYNEIQKNPCYCTMKKKRRNN